MTMIEFLVPNCYLLRGHNYANGRSRGAGCSEARHSLVIICISVKKIAKPTFELVENKQIYIYQPNEIEAGSAVLQRRRCTWPRTHMALEVK